MRAWLAQSPAELCNCKLEAVTAPRTQHGRSTAVFEADNIAALSQAHLLADLATRAVLSIDDDMHVPCDMLDKALAVRHYSYVASLLAGLLAGHAPFFPELCLLAKLIRTGL